MAKGDYFDMRFAVALVLTLLLLGMAHAQDQVLLIQRMWADSPTREATDCVEVKGDGSYRFEHTPIDLGRPDRPQVHLGKLTDEEMKQLTDLLDNPALQSLNTPSLSKGAVSGGDLWWFSINRSGHSQLLRFASSSGAYYEVPARGGLPSLSQTPAVKPLANWYKQITKRKDDVDKTATPTCSLKVRSQ
jgi:hypothetical protein